MDDDFIEDDIPYDIDLIAEELRFYQEASEQQEEEAPLTGRDSGYGTARWDKNLPLATRNSIQADHNVTNKIYWDNVMKKEMLSIYEDSKQFLILNPRSIVFHILQFLRPSCHFRRENEDCLFSVKNDRVVMHRNFSFENSAIEFPKQRETWETMVTFFLPSRQQIDEIITFVERQEAVPNPPVFLECLCSVIREFIEDYMVSIEKLQHENIALSAINSHTYDLREKTRMLYQIISPIKSGYKWKWIEVEYAWFILINITGSFVNNSVEVVDYAIRIQTQFLKSLFVFLDQLFSSRYVPSGFTEHSIFINDPSDPEQIQVRNAGDNNLTLWTMPLITEVIRALRFRKMLKKRSYAEPYFTAAVEKEIEAELVFQDHRLFNVDQLREIMLRSAIRVSNSWSTELFTVTKEMNLVSLYKDMNTLLIGQFSDVLAQYLYKPGRKEMYVAQLMSSCGLSRNIFWDLNLKTLNFSVMIPPPLDSVFRPSLIEAMSGFLRLWLKLYRMKELLEAIKYDTFRGLSRAVPAKRRFRFIVEKLSKIVGVMREQFYLTLSHLIDNTIKKIELAENFVDVELVCRETESLIISWTSVQSASVVKDILRIIDIYEELIDDIRLKSLSGHVEDEHMSDWNKKTTRTIEYLVSVGKNSPPSSIFYFVYLQLGYRPLFIKTS